MGTSLINNDQYKEEEQVSILSYNNFLCLTRVMSNGFDGAFKSIYNII